MQATIYELEGPYRLTLKHTDLDERSLGKHEVMAVTEFTAISRGTEIAAWIGLPPLRPMNAYPRLVGYCNTARVVAVGSKVESVAIGAHILTHQSHRSAFICNESDVLLHIHEENRHILKKLTATYLYHLGYSALLAGSYSPGHEVAVVGMGTLGLTTAVLAKAFGTQPFVFTDQKIPEHILRALGLDHILRKENCTDAVARLSRVGGTDIVVNTSNRWEDYLLCLQIARKGGQIVCLGFPGRGDPTPKFNPLDSQYFYDKQLTVKSCGYVSALDVSPSDLRFTLKRNVAYLASLIVDNVIDPIHILSFESSWAELAGVYARLESPEPGVFSALIDWAA